MGGRGGRLPRGISSTWQGVQLPQQEKLPPVRTPLFCQSLGTQSHLVSVQHGALLGEMQGHEQTDTREMTVLCIFNNIYLYRFSKSVHSVLTCFFLHKQKNSYNSRLSKINTIKIELQNKYSIQREPSVVTLLWGEKGLQ